jgi:hypothetical protein
VERSDTSNHESNSNSPQLDGRGSRLEPVLSHQNPVLREVLGDGGGIVLVERIGMFFNDRDKLLT